MRHFTNILTSAIGKVIGQKLDANHDFGQIANTLIVEGKIVRAIGESPIVISDSDHFTAFHVIDKVIPNQIGQRSRYPFSRPLNEQVGSDIRISGRFFIFGYDMLSDADAWGLISLFQDRRYEIKDSTETTLASGKTNFKEAIPDLITILKNLGMTDAFAQLQAKQQQITAMQIGYEIEAYVCDFCIANATPDTG